MIGVSVARTENLCITEMSITKKADHVNLPVYLPLKSDVMLKMLLSNHLRSFKMKTLYDMVDNCLNMNDNKWKDRITEEM